MNMLREDIKDKRLIDLIKKYLKSGVKENGIVMKTKEGSPGNEEISLRYLPISTLINSIGSSRAEE